MLLTIVTILPQAGQTKDHFVAGLALIAALALICGKTVEQRHINPANHAAGSPAVQADLAFILGRNAESWDLYGNDAPETPRQGFAGLGDKDGANTGSA